MFKDFSQQTKCDYVEEVDFPSIPQVTINIEQKKDPNSSTFSGVTKDPITYEKISSIKPIANTKVCDFETESTNHTFIAGDGFVVSNCSMGKQSLGPYHSNYDTRWETTARVLAFPSRPMFETQMNELIGLGSLPAGQTVTLAFMTYTGYNQEDSVIINKGAIDRGLFRSVMYKSYVVIETGPNKNVKEKFERPPADTAKFPDQFEALDENGIAVPGRKVKERQVIISKMRKDMETGKVEYINTEIGISEEGVVHSIMVDTNANGEKIVRVKIRQVRIPQIGDKFACYTPDHEVLTTTGWIPIADITTQHQIATLNTQTNELEYRNPTETQAYDYDGEMIEVDSSQVSLCVTPNHRMYVKRRGQKQFKIYEASQIYQSPVNYKKNAEWWPEDEMIDFVLPACTYQYYNVVHNVKDRNLPLEPWLTFFGIWIAEGCCDKTKCVDIAINKKRVKDELMKLAPHLDFEHAISKDGLKMYIYDRQLMTYLDALSVGAINKRLPEWVWSLNMTECQILLEGMILGDGTMNGNTPIYYTSSVGLKDDVMRLALHCGWAANATMREEAGTKHVIHEKEYSTNADAWSITIVKTQVEPGVCKKGIDSHKQNQKINYKGKIYCCTTQNGVIYVRRTTGKGEYKNKEKYTQLAVWCGQSRHAQKGTMGIYLDESDMPVRLRTREAVTVIINPHAIPSRMTIAKLIEVVASKYAAMKGERVNATAFNNFNIDEYKRNLVQYGFTDNGNEVLQNPRTGAMYSTQIFVGPCYYQVLRHQVKDKYQMRARGAVRPITFQPISGRKRNGAIRSTGRSRMTKIRLVCSVAGDTS